MDGRELEAFVIGPIGDKDAESGSPARIAYERAIEVLEEIIEPACKFCGLQSVRADQISRTGEINDQIFRRLRDAYLVIADVSGANPNVMYELGLRHSTGKLTVQIGERDHLPFDISAIRTIRFKRTPNGIVEARRQLGSSISTALSSGGDPVAATRIWFESRGELVPEEGETARIDDEETDEPGFLEIQAESEIAIVELTQSLEVLSTITEEIGVIFTKGTAQVRLIESRAGGAVDRLALADQLAGELEGPATRFGIGSAEYARHLDRVLPGMISLMDQIEAEPLLVNDAAGFLESALGFLVSTREALDSTKKFGESFQGTGAMTRKMKRVAKTINSGINLMIDSSNKIFNLEDRIISIQSIQKESKNV
ncbi:hypothetical protein FVQ98_03965 [Ottowia sp. GY511]|uniref:Uncharacterized protein n=1 Tax=Ottowia flava TaxID=2675430 RepID=A0ABW4KT33_9BURK|nr:hypothetical protein [Ottowia sp. GY511]TXK33144.1 hypothetical protein FVQ98_03965 [Ottowia sp. GY511]